MVATIDHLASEAGVSVLQAGGNAVDAALAANAVLAVTAQHMCGLGGDLFALVHVPGEAQPRCLNASGRAGTGADPAALRSEGLAHIPPTGDIRAVTVPGCVDGWVALNEAFGSMELGEVLAAARRYAIEGFPASPLLAAASRGLAGLDDVGEFSAAAAAGTLVRRPRLARTLEAVAASGRAGFYLGEFGSGLLSLGRGLFAEADLERSNADWVDPVSVDVWGHRIWTTPPNSQGYLTLSSARISELAGLGPDPSDAGWAHLTIEAAWDRPDVLHEHADAGVLLDPEGLRRRAAAISTDAASDLAGSFGSGDTTYLCALDEDGMGISLIQSNAQGFGSLLVEPHTGVFLHNRGIGFSPETGHPAEYGPGRRPPHTLSPGLVTAAASGEAGGELTALVGTMGGDAQPQVLLQLLARLLLSGESAGDAVSAPRWVLSGRQHSGGFETWAERGDVRVHLEDGPGEGWAEGLTRRGHEVVTHPVLAYNFGHAQVIRRLPSGVLEGASDPRALIGSASGY